MNGEVFRESRLFQHSGGVAANTGRAIRFKTMVGIKFEDAGALGKRAFVSDELTVVLTAIFQRIYLEHANGRGIEANAFCLRCHRRVLDLEYLLAHDAVIGNAEIGQHAPKIFPVPSPTEALAMKDRVVA